MDIQQILTKRAAIKKTMAFPLDIVFEWEDILSAELRIPLRNHFSSIRYIGALCYRMPYLARFFRPYKNSLSFNIYANDIFKTNYKSIIPWIIDFFYTTSEEFQGFYRAYDKCPLVFISSREVYDVLVEKGCPLPIRHLGLSISDKYVLNSAILNEKKYDVGIMGRNSKILVDYCKRYQKAHPEFSYIFRDKAKDGSLCYCTSKGEIIGPARTRGEYMQILQKIRVGLYATPGVDADRNVRYNQVTPRFLEYIVSGCHVLSRYKTNSDTEFYDLDSMTSNIESYDHFVFELESALQNPIDVEKYQG